MSRRADGERGLSGRPSGPGSGVAGLVGVLVADDAPGPVEEERAVGVRYAEQVGEVEQGVVVGDLGDEVAGAVALPAPR